MTMRRISINARPVKRRERTVPFFAYFTYQK